MKMFYNSIESSITSSSISQWLYVKVRVFCRPYHVTQQTTLTLNSSAFWCQSIEGEWRLFTQEAQLSLRWGRPYWLSLTLKVIQSRWT